MRFFPVFVCALPLFAAPPFTLEQVLSSPFPSDLTASPRGDAVVWVQDAKGVRNIWMARAAGWRGEQITNFSADDGQEIGDLNWQADSSAVFFTRGGGQNSRGESPNPRNDPAGVRQEVWTVTLPTSTARMDAHKLGDGHSPAASPDGSMVAWISGGQIWACGLSPNVRPAQLVHARGTAADLVWAPGGQQLAFTSERGDHAFIGVYDAAAKTLNYVDASVNGDQSPAWSPDGSELALIRIPANRLSALYGAKRAGQPWSIRVVDVKTGQGREVFLAREGMGSVFWPIASSRQLMWAGNGRIVFPWEGDGWLHLYSLTSSGQKVSPEPLTPGQFEVEHAALAIGAREVIYSSNQNDSERRHLWKVKTTGGTPELLTPGAEIEWSPAALADGRIAFLHSSWKNPARAATFDNGKAADLAPQSMPADFPSALLTEPQPVEFPATDGMRIQGQLFLPANAAQGKHAAVIFFHGGSRREMFLGWHSMFYYHQAYAFNQYLASRGFIVLSVNYRSGVGYGEAFREALKFGPTGASEFNDVKGAGVYLRARSDVDSARIGLWGGSYGGYLTALGLSRASDMFAAGVDLHGVHDWNLEISNPMPVYEPEQRLAVARLAFESSPMSSIATWKSPVLLIQGDDDRNVPFAETVQLAEALTKRGVEIRELIFPDEIHDFLVHAHWLQAYQAATTFLEEKLHP